ncbi:hypothetical protein COU19_02255 [Candidatus Kaiserbacteria bacterium CG10_big_fil_rev_8_21_14_0_10_56_12]|uniref:Hydrolase TatD n=1 Tax=Candidatus Kaiserbacteria bacterium CG10_big_fil_rev_8_21_14_0_10_56_12 TaxID=1974611 RepID=A0A2H0U9J8_9BACT|nr:MAG: hypothetical protein COU19_02255 [Candidatus Kaiserbacteria bacterium CG10_big_fil_rev_8_21_14_0_10_56_12]
MPNMETRYIDAHCHVQFEQYDADRAEVIDEMRSQGVAGIVVGCDLDSSQKAVALAEKHEHLYAAVGLHPNHESSEWYDISYQRQLAAHPKVVAIGECGLDYYRLPGDTSVHSAEATKVKQKTLFKQHLALAIEFDKPLIIHCRPSKGSTDAYRDLIELLEEERSKDLNTHLNTYQNLRGDIHFFVGGVAEAQALNALGFTVSFTAVITFMHDYDAVIKTVPLANLLVETDAPYVAPAVRRGQRNDPLAVIDVVSRIARIREEDPESVRQTLLENTRQLFDLARP